MHSKLEVLDMEKYPNKQYPIILRDIEPIIDRIHYKCPELSKLQITSIIKSFFEVIRFILINGNKITINNLFSKFEFVLSEKTYKNKIITAVLSKLSTPISMRKYDRR